jgi:hypothetical protein
MPATIRQPRIIPNFMSAVVGAFVALLYLGPLPSSLRGTAAILAAGATFGIFLASAVYLFWGLPDAAFYSVAAVAGAAGGAGWWLIVRPSISILFPLLIGAGMALLAAVLEGRPAQPQR